MCNDYNKKICQKLSENLNFKIYNKDIRSEQITVPENTLVDLDPFGSALPFLDSLSLFNAKYYSVCFTDVINLCSTKRKNYLKNQYNAIVYKTKLTQEQGLRLAAKIIVEKFNKQNKKVNFIFSYCNLHYLKFYFFVETGSNNKQDINTIKYCQVCKLYNSAECICEKNDFVGPFFLGELYTLQFILKLKNVIENKILLKILDKYIAPDLPFGFDIENICRLNNHPIIKKKQFNSIGFESPYDENIIKSKLDIRNILSFAKNKFGGS